LVRVDPTGSAAGTTGRPIENDGGLFAMSGRDEGGRARAEDVIESLAARQHGVVTRGQLLAAGLAPDVVDRRVKQSRLRAMHRGVYRVGPLVAPHAQEMAAALACGPDAVIGHWSATVLWGLLSNVARPAVPEVIDRRGSHRVPGVRIHRVRTLRSDEITKLEGIPVTTPTRTLFDLATLAGRRDLERAVWEAMAKRLTTPDRIRALVECRRGARGTRRLSTVVEAGGPGFTRSEAEERFLALVREAQISEPESNVVVNDFEVDFLWRAEGLVVEIDGFAFHSTHRSFESDRRRDAVLASMGVRVVRVTWRQIVAEPIPLVARLAQTLATCRVVAAPHGLNRGEARRSDVPAPATVATQAPARIATDSASRTRGSLR
jgi:very-short-patch-repair endonuclease